MSEPQLMSDDMALAKLYSLALDMAQELGAIVPAGARHHGPYGFMERVRRELPGATFTWEGRTL